MLMTEIPIRDIKLLKYFKDNFLKRWNSERNIEINKTSTSTFIIYTCII